MLVTEISADTRAVVDALLACPIGETVTFAALSAAIGRDITKHRHVVVAARRVAEREAGAVFTSVRGVGYRRLDAETTVAVVARRWLARMTGQTAKADG